MKVFISWSGERSGKLADEFSTWLRSALQKVNPFLSRKDIDKGEGWSTRIAKELEETEVGVLFVTQENLGSPWLLFEAGALSKQLGQARVCTVTVDIDPINLPAPLRQFQATSIDRGDFLHLFETINNASPVDRLDDASVQRVFEKWWPDLEAAFTGILEEDPPESPAIPSERRLLEEIRLRSEEIGRQLRQLHRSLSEGGHPASEGVHPAAVKELAIALSDMHGTIQHGSNGHSLMDLLESTTKALRHMSARMNRSPEDQLLLARKAVTEFLDLDFRNYNSEYDEVTDGTTART